MTAHSLSPGNFLSHWSQAWVGSVLLFFALGLSRAHAASGYKEIAYFEEGRVANLSIVVEYKPDGTRSINVRFNRPPHGVTLFFHEAEWKAFRDNLGRVKQGADGAEQTFADLNTPGGSLLRMSAVRHGGEVRLTLSRQPTKGDSYPPVEFHLSPTDFENLLKATLQAAQANILVSAASAAEFVRFRADLGTRFTADELRDFDIAIQELQLEAANRHITTEAGALASANRRTISEVLLFGWRARKDRVIREIPGAIQAVNQDTAEAARTAATGTPEAITHRLASEKETLAKLRHDRDDALHHLDDLDAIIGRPR